VDGRWAKGVHESFLHTDVIRYETHTWSFHVRFLYKKVLERIKKGSKFVDPKMEPLKRVIEMTSVYTYLSH
jgi:hypothetical protein